MDVWRRNRVRFHSPIPPMLALVLAACASSPDAPSPSGPVARGEAVAHRLCASCHATGRFDKSRHVDAPPFRNLSENYPVADLAESLVEGLMTGHADMPEYQFTPEGAQDFIAYLESIQETGVHRVDPGT